MDETTTDAAAADTQALDPTSSNPRELMQALLPTARRSYIRAWELLADASTPLERRRAARDRASTIASDHSLVAQALRAREGSLRGDDLQNARHLASELERHADALERLVTVSPVGLQTSKELRPESLGCGRRYRDPAKAPKEQPKDARDRRGGKRTGPGGGKAGDAGDKRRSSRPFQDRGPKVSRDALGSTKHDSQLGDDLDPDTRAKLEALRSQLDG